MQIEPSTQRRAPGTNPGGISPHPTPGTTSRTAHLSQSSAGANGGRLRSPFTRRALAGALALATAASIAACGSSSSTNTSPTGKKLDMARVVGSIEESFLSKRHIHAKVTCPVSVEQREGNNFTCTATGFAGTGSSRKPFTVHVGVTQANNNGYVTYVSY